MLTKRYQHLPHILLAAFVAIIGCAQAIAQNDAGEGGGGVPGVASRAVIQIQERIKKADNLAANGAQLQTNGMNKEAMEVYKQAFEITPAVPATTQRRLAFFNRYQSTSASYAQTLIDQAQYDKSKLVLEDVYKTAQQSGDIPPTSINLQVKTLLARLNGDYYNRAMTPKHLSNVSAVERLLLTAKGAADLGDFNKSQKTYNQVLEIDPYNSAARRGLEIVERMILEYQEVSRNSTRARMLGKIAEGWVLPVPPDLSAAGANFKYSDALIGSPQALLEQKLKNIEIPRMEFQEATLRDVLDFLTRNSQELDTSESDPAKRGVNFIIDGDPQAADRTVTIQLSNIPLGSALNYVCQIVGMKYRVDQFAVRIVPLSSTEDQQMVSRTFVVPPDFLSGGSGGGGGAAVIDDPFGTPDANNSGATPLSRLSAQEFLQQAGVTFDSGASASYNPRTSVLTIRNRPDQIELIEALVADSRASVSKIVKVDFKMVSMTTTGVKELGFDWLLGQGNFPGSDRVFLGGGTPGNAAQNRNASDYPFRDPVTGLPIGDPVTSGLRSGNTRGNLTIDDVIAREGPTDPTRPQPPSPALFGIAGVFTDPQFQTVIRAVSQLKSTDQLCAASVVVRPGERASIRQVREFIYPTEYDPPELPSTVGVAPLGNNLLLETEVGTSFPVTPATPTAFEMRELGKVIEVEPVVGEDNQTVSLSITTDLSDFVGFINYGTPIGTAGIGASGPQNVRITDNRILMPVFDAIKETTNITIWDTQTIAIGGLIQDDVDVVEDKVPVLGDLPLVGRAFRSKGKDQKRRAIVLFVSVRILDPSGQSIRDANVETNTLPPQPTF